MTDPLYPDQTQPFSVNNDVMLRALADVPHHPFLEEMVDVMTAKVMRNNPHFFRVIALYFAGKVASFMRVQVKRYDSKLPANNYCLALAPSGYGKGHSVGICEDEFLHLFEQRFLNDTLPAVTEMNLYDLACDRALISGKDPNEELEIARREHQNLGAFMPSFELGSAAAIKDTARSLQMSGVGALALEMDEIGDNLSRGEDGLIPFLSLYDKGKLKGNMRKNTADNTRGRYLSGVSPSCALFFGTPSSLLDGHDTEKTFISLLNTGYSRRLIFAWATKSDQAIMLSARELEDLRSDPKLSNNASHIAQHFHNLCDPARINWTVDLPPDVSLELTTYELFCKNRANELKTVDTIRMHDMDGRASKAMKTGAILAFLDESTSMTMDNLYQAIKIVEDSGASLDALLKREPNYARLARFIAESGNELTHTDIAEDLHFYKSTNRKDLMTDAISWGYKNHIIIRKAYRDEGIEVFTGETLKETDLAKLSISASGHVAEGYQPFTVAFENLEELAKQDGLHWCTHAFLNGHRNSENAIPGFNMIVLDVDDGTPLHVAHELMADYTFMTYTTKRHQTEGFGDRYRMILPINYTLKLDKDTYREFMRSIFEWLPFAEPTDDSADQISKKWLTNASADVFFNHDGVLLDALPFLPHTSRNEKHVKRMQEISNMDNLERWFAQKIGNGTHHNRNKLMHDYARVLVDAGLNFAAIEQALMTFDKRLPNGIGEDEIRGSILITVAKEVHERKIA